MIGGAMDTRNQDELIGRLYRHKAADRKRLAFVNAELDDIAGLFKKAAAQLEAMLAHQPFHLDPVLSRINIDHILHLLAERRDLQRRIDEANEQLRKLGVQV